MVVPLQLPALPSGVGEAELQALIDAHKTNALSPNAAVTEVLIIGPVLGMLSGKYMPKTPKGHKRPADVVSNAVHVMKIATAEIEELGDTDDGKSKAAVELGRKGGVARAKALSTRKRREIAQKAAKARWE